ncbi:ribosome biogenesis regulatory protein-domain-containing protein [Catenaria anguillulae PL171]|uniref:Ribosome biogenesis regulatory protein n=1 Tax=Catenaria anguillulae PL171 TaxID=765915 RepID=A0A1Y2HQZ2_9FUNG|nr:ribosome biogenesis regulatory protein-domain-containing protein [Catenaria anguillulae PL171]
MDATQQIEQAKSKFKPVTVDRLAPPTLDLGHLAIFDPNALQESHKPRSDDLERYLTSISRDSAQLLYNAIFALDTSADADGVFVDLPLPITQVPREKPLPKEKAQTRWEKFAKEKGIQKRKKSRMEYDEATGEYRPRWGYGSAKNDAANDWLIPVPKNADPYQDMYEQKREEKKERIEKNKKQQIRNAAEAAAVERGEDPRVARKRELEAKLRMSKKATASAGVFDRKLDGDIKLKGIKRQFAPTVGDGSVERDSASNVATRVLKKQDEKTSGSIKVQKATGMLQRADERKNRDRKRAAGDDDRKGGGKKRKFK